MCVDLRFTNYFNLQNSCEIEAGFLNQQRNVRKQK